MDWIKNVSIYSFCVKWCVLTEMYCWQFVYSWGCVATYHTKPWLFFVTFCHRVHRDCSNFYSVSSVARISLARGHTYFFMMNLWSHLLFEIILSEWYNSVDQSDIPLKGGDKLSPPLESNLMLGVESLKAVFLKNSGTDQYIKAHRYWQIRFCALRRLVCCVLQGCYDCSRQSAFQ